MDITTHDNSGRDFSEAFVRENEGRVFMWSANLFIYSINDRNAVLNGMPIDEALKLFKIMTSGKYTNVDIYPGNRGNPNGFMDYLTIILPPLFHDCNSFEVGEEVCWLETVLPFSYESTIPYEVDATPRGVRVSDDNGKILAKNIDNTYLVDCGFTQPIKLQGEVLCRPMELIPYVV